MDLQKKLPNRNDYIRFALDGLRCVCLPQDEKRWDDITFIGVLCNFAHAIATLYDRQEEEKKEQEGAVCFRQGAESVYPRAGEMVRYRRSPWTGQTADDLTSAFIPPFVYPTQRSASCIEHSLKSSIRVWSNGPIRRKRPRLSHTRCSIMAGSSSVTTD